MSDLTPKIYVASLAAYNNGKLHGVWIDRLDDADYVHEQIKEMLKTCPEKGEEWAIHDKEDFGGIELSEYEGIDRIVELATFLEEHGTLGAAVLDYADNEIDRATQLLEECYEGEYDSEADFADEFTHALNEIPDYLEYYIDWEKMARDLFMGDYFSVKIGYKIHVFRNE